MCSGEQVQACTLSRHVSGHVPGSLTWPSPLDRTLACYSDTVPPALRLRRSTNHHFNIHHDFKSHQLMTCPMIQNLDGSLNVLFIQMT